MYTPAASPLASAKSSRALGLGCAIPFGLVFAVIGLVAFWAITLGPLLRASASRSWVEAPCVILESALETSRGSDNDTYRVAIRYRYVWQGETYEGERYDFTTGFTNVGVARMRAAVADHPPGRHTVCHVDPDDPASAVLSRELGGGLWFGAIALLFPLFGGLFIFFAWRGGRAAGAQASPLAPAGAAGAGGAAGLRSPRGASGAKTFAADPAAQGEVALRPASGRVTTLFVTLGIALFWNGIVGVFVSQVVKDFGRGGIFPWFLALFLVPFVLVGLLLIGAVLQAVSRLFAPPVELRLEPARLRLGARVPFTWRLGGRGVRKLTLRLVAREEASYRQGTRTSTDKSDFFRATLFESTDRLALSEGRGELVLPEAAAAPALQAANNKIVWELVVAGEIPWRADVDDRFVLPVRGPSAPAPVANVAPDPIAHSAAGLTLWSVESFAPGETLVFTLARDAAPARESDGPLTVQLGWFTEGRGTSDAAVVWTEKIPGLAAGDERGFELRLPEEPWSFSGKLVAVAWRLEVLDAKGKPLVAVPLTLAPGGRPVALPALEPEPSAFALRKARYLEKRAARGRSPGAEGP
jgi:hypothetical protein